MQKDAELCECSPCSQWHGKTTHSLPISILLFKWLSFSAIQWDRQHCSMWHCFSLLYTHGCQAWQKNSLLYGSLHIRQNYLQHQEHTMISTVSNSCSCICICINEHNYSTNVALLFPSLYTRLSGCSAEYYTDGWPSVPRVEASFFGNVDWIVAHNINASICNA